MRWRIPIDFRAIRCAGREQAERSSGSAAKQAEQMPERRRLGSLLPAYKKVAGLQKNQQAVSSHRSVSSVSEIREPQIIPMRQNTERNADPTQAIAVGLAWVHLIQDRRPMVISRWCQ